MSQGTPIALEQAFAALRFLPDRTPHSSAEARAGAFATLSAYRDGGVFIGHYAGNSEWERHRQGDELVMVVGGETTLVLLVDGEQRRHTLGAGELLVVPRATWHRFETPGGVKVLTVTPQPTDHRLEMPSAD